MEDKLKAMKYKVVIVDESHYMKVVILILILKLILIPILIEHEGQENTELVTNTEGNAINNNTKIIPILMPILILI